jgi:pentose-5-phosphate-3-epimerase
VTANRIQSNERNRPVFPGWSNRAGFLGDRVDQQLKQLMKELGEAINESLADSEQIAEVVSKIKEGGYDIFLVLEATIGVSKPGEKSSDKTSMVTTLTSNPEFKVSDQDLKFLKSLRIKIDDRT